MQAVFGQSIPAGVEMTRPLPVPLSATVSVATRWANVAVIWRSRLTVTAHAAPEQSPLNPTNCQPAAGVAARVNAAPSASDAAQLCTQSTPEGELCTAPAPTIETCTLCVAALAAKVAPMETSALATTSQAAAPEQGPDQPAKLAAP